MNQEIRNSQGEKLDYSFHGDAGSDRVLVIGHGVTGNKDRPLVVALAEGAAEAGLAVVRVSFSGNGDSEGTFGDSTISKEVADLGAVLDAVGEGKTIVYAGHSMGGAVGVLRASSDDRISALVSLAGMVHTAKFAEVEFGEETPDAGCMWEEESCPLSSTYVNDMKAIDSVLEKGAEVKVPWLLVHGTEDDVVPPGESDEIFAKANEPKQLLVVEGGDHVFSEPAHQKEMVEGVVGWLAFSI